MKNNTSLLSSPCHSDDYEALYDYVRSLAGEGEGIAHNRRDICSLYDLTVDNRDGRFPSTERVVLRVIYSLDAHGYLDIEAVLAK